MGSGKEWSPLLSSSIYITSNQGIGRSKCKITRAKATSGSTATLVQLMERKSHTFDDRTLNYRTIVRVRFQNSFEVKVDGSWTWLVTAYHHFSSYIRIYFAIAGHRSHCSRISASWHLEHCRLETDRRFVVRCWR
ncbi:hypothetical protein BDN71DRAFT_420681 [Pleurotus eryngii]|uniref:Uncharacterized protein n=1 Tax=Pleurotus eryngii TaxID=5323 RepID=A0A9P6DI44_PLEER|nr:hypothetical protein BDN71DRAFT_420681 [Pleurotus eryngii]